MYKKYTYMIRAKQNSQSKHNLHDTRYSLQLPTLFDDCTTDTKKKIPKKKKTKNPHHYKTSSFLKPLEI